MERLKDLTATVSGALSIVFTFQYGEIKSAMSQDMKRPARYLHSSMERLKAVVCAIPDALHCNLHSSMERLKGMCLKSHILMLYQFTFQYGEIKSCGDLAKKSHSSDLHSSMERLKGEAGIKTSGGSMLIYIPVWRD